MYGMCVTGPTNRPAGLPVDRLTRFRQSSLCKWKIRFHTIHEGTDALLSDDWRDNSRIFTHQTQKVYCLRLWSVWKWLPATLSTQNGSIKCVTMIWWGRCSWTQTAKSFFIFFLEFYLLPSTTTTEKEREPGDVEKTRHILCNLLW